MKDLYKKTFSRFDAKQVSAQDIINRSKKSSAVNAKYIKKAACIVAAVMILIPTSAYASNHIVKNNKYYQSFYGKFNKDFITEPVYENGEELVAKNTSTTTPVSEEDTKRILGDSVNELDTVNNIDGIKVTVEASTFDNETKAGQIYFSLEKKGIKSDVAILGKGDIYCTKKYYLTLSETMKTLIVDTANSTDDKLCIKAYYICPYNKDVDSSSQTFIYFYNNIVNNEKDESGELGRVSVPIKNKNINVKQAAKNDVTVTISPIAIKIKSKKIDMQESNDSGTIVLKDGTKFLLDKNASTGCLEEDGDYGIVTVAFDTLLDVDKIDKVIVCGETIEID